MGLWKLRILPVLLLGLTVLAWPATVMAAEFHAGQTVTFTNSDHLNNAYVAGNQVTISAPVTNDLVVAGGTVVINTHVDHSLIVAGGNVTIDGDVGQNLRVAGGDVLVNGSVGQDVVAIGGTVTLASSAKVGGDVAATGGTINIQAPVAGRVTTNCGCDVTLNSKIGQFDGKVQQLHLGSHAEITGTLSYRAPQKFTQDQRAIVRGDTTYQPVNGQPEHNFQAASFFYNLIASLIFGAVLLFVFRALPEIGATVSRRHPLATFGWGLGTLILFPIVAVLLLIFSVWLGISAFLLYALMLIVGYFLGQLLLGWGLLTWWFGRNHEAYALDWRALIVGVLATTILLLVPVLGWFILFIALLFALGGLAQGLLRLRHGGAAA